MGLSILNSFFFTFHTDIAQPKKKDWTGGIQKNNMRARIGILGRGAGETSTRSRACCPIEYVTRSADKRRGQVQFNIKFGGDRRTNRSLCESLGIRFSAFGS